MIHLYNEALVGDFTIYPLLVLILLSQSILSVNSCINRRTLTGNVLNEYYGNSKKCIFLKNNTLLYISSPYFHLVIEHNTYTSRDLVRKKNLQVVGYLKLQVAVKFNQLKNLDGKTKVNWVAKKVARQVSRL